MRVKLMPIKKELRYFYGREWRTVTRPLILKRAKNRCEQCGVLNHDIGYRTRDGKFHRAKPNSGAPRGHRLIRIVLTVAHLDGVAGHDDPANLAALCQRCHLLHDLDFHHQTRAKRKDQTRPLLAQEGAA